MTFTRMSAGYPHRIRAFSECGEYKFRTHSAGTWNPNDPDICRIFHPGHTGQICCTIGAPVAQEADDFNFLFTHYV